MPWCGACRLQALAEVLQWDRGTALYTVAAGLEAIAAVACPPASRTTDPIMLHALLSHVAQLGHPLFQLFSHPSCEPASWGMELRVPWKGPRICCTSWGSADASNAVLLKRHDRAHA